MVNSVCVVISGGNLYGHSVHGCYSRFAFYPEPQYRIYTTAIERNVRVYHSFLQLGSYVSEEFVVCEGRILNSLSLIRARFLSPDGWDSCDVWKAVIDRENQPAWHSKDSELKEFRLFRIQSLSRYFLCLYSPCCRQ